MSDDFLRTLKQLYESGALDEESYRKARDAHTRKGAEDRTGGSGGRASSGGTAAGQRGVAVGGDVHGDVIIEGTVKRGGSPTGLRRAYLSWVLGEARALRLAGVDPRAKDPDEEGGADLDLAAVYTALKTKSPQPPVEKDGRKSETVQLDVRGTRELSALEVLNAEPRLALLGDPGSGKSTFVNYVALCLAGEGLGRPSANLKTLTAPIPSPNRSRKKEISQPWDHGALIPVRVVLRDFAARGLAARSDEALWKHIVAELPGTLEGFAEHLKTELIDPGGLLLLDGLDEVPQAERLRVKVKEAVRRFGDTFEKTRVLVTSRTYAYQRQEWRLGDFAEAVLAPFDEDQIQRFVERWYAHVGPLRGFPAQDAQGHAAALNQAIRRTPSLAELAQRPLLLTLMASLHAWKRGILPEEREKLYAEAVELLLAQWESQKVRRRADAEPELIQPSLSEWLRCDQGAVRTLLQRLAFQAQRDQPKEERGTADVPQTALVEGLTALNTNPAPMGQLIEHLGRRCGLLEPRGVGVYTFPHRTFQEYLAACHLSDLPDFTDQLSKLLRKDPQRWREVILLAGAKAARGMASAAWMVAEALCPGAYSTRLGEKRRREGAWGALLAAQVLLESSRLGQISGKRRKMQDRVRRWLERTVVAGLLPAIDRSLSGDALARLGDPRRQVTEVDAMQFCWVPGGPFRMGSERGDDDPKTAHTNETLKSDVWMGLFPVTVAQFEEFIQDGGYDKAEYWQEARHNKAWKDGQVKDWSGEERNRPIDFGEPFSLDNHPVVGVTWYEALAFARWLEERWRGAGKLPVGWRVRLPSEAEWEKAARGGERVPVDPVVGLPGAPAVGLKENPGPEAEYPWGEWAGDRCNSEESKIGSTSAVGLFHQGQSPHGCEEMAGNVLEWTGCPWRPDHSARAKVDRDSKEPYVIRGGSWVWYKEWSRCSFRNRTDPDYWYYSLGFRVMLSRSGS